MTVIDLNKNSRDNKWVMSIEGEDGPIERMTAMCVSRTLSNRGISYDDVVFASQEAQVAYSEESARISSGW